MLLKKYKLVSFFILLLFIGCGEEHNNSSSKQIANQDNTNEIALTGNDFQNENSDNTQISQKVLETTAKWKNNTVKWWYNPDKQKFANTTEAIQQF